MNTLDELRIMAEKVLVESPRNFNPDEWGKNFKALLEELSIYQIELEHQNKELERSEKLLAVAHEEYVKLFESTPVGYVILDESRNIIKVNKTFIKTFVGTHAKIQQVEGRCFDEFVTPEFRNSFVVFCKIAQTKFTPIPVELKLIGRHKTPRYVMLTAHTYSIDKKTIAITTSDISMQKAMEEQLVKAQNMEVISSQKKSRFLTNVSQQLRTPLAAIVGYKEIMADSELSDSEKIECCTEIITVSEMLQNLSDRILDISALENGDTSIINQVVDMEKLCKKHTMLFSRFLRKKNASLTVQVDTVPLILSDPFRLGQIINSVLDYASGNVTRGNIVFDCTYEHGYDNYGKLLLTFTGEEIFSSEKDSIKQNDFTLHGSTHVNLNMFMVKRLVDVLNGQMIWEHPLNILRIEIPVTISTEDKEVCSEKESSSSDSETQSSEAKTCLLVDDVVMNLKILSAMMKKLGYTPTMASSGTEARKLSNDHRFDVIMTDLWMPEINGEDLAIVLRQNPDYDDVPIFAVTADVEYNHNFDMDFFTGTVIKPVSLEKLRKVLLDHEEKK